MSSVACTLAAMSSMTWHGARPLARHAQHLDLLWLVVVTLSALLLLATFWSAPTTRPHPAGTPFAPVPTRSEGVGDLAHWRDGEGREQLLVAAGDGIAAYDAESGRPFWRAGHHGNAPGQFDDIRALAVADDVLFVAEQGNRRVQALALPDLRPLQQFALPAPLRPASLQTQVLGQGGVRICVGAVDSRTVCAALLHWQRGGGDVAASVASRH